MYFEILFRTLVSSFSNFTKIVAVNIDEAFKGVFDFIESIYDIINCTLHFVRLDKFFSAFPGLYIKKPFDYQNLIYHRFPSVRYFLNMRPNLRFILILYEASTFLNLISFNQFISTHSFVCHQKPLLME